MTKQLYEDMEKLKAKTRDYLKRDIKSELKINLSALICKIEDTQLNLKRSEEE